MPARTIRIWPDPVLSTRAAPVASVTDETRTLVGDLFATMYASGGIGLAANQVGELSRVIVIDLDPDRRRGSDRAVDEELSGYGFVHALTLINPEIVASSGEIVWEEGCLSVPGYADSVRRKAKVRVRALDAEGQLQEFDAEGLFAVCIQHEIDHLDGRVFVEYLSKLKRDTVRRKMMRLKASGETTTPSDEDGRIAS